MCVIVRDEAAYIEEWLAFHLLQGASKILVYDNGSTDGTLQRLAQAAANAPINVIDWSEQSGHFDTIQRAAYMDGAARLIGSSDFVAFIDADEFLHAGVGRTAAGTLSAFPSEVSAVAVNQRVFGSSGFIKYGAAPVTSRFVRCTELEYVENRWFKTIARPEQIIEFDSVHSVVVRSGRYVMNDGGDLSRESDHPGLASRVGSGALTVNHYMLRSLEEYREKQKRWQSRSEMYERYSMGYFHGREPAANAVVDDRLAPLSEQVEHMMFRLRAGTQPVKVETPSTFDAASPLETASASVEHSVVEPQISTSALGTRMLRWLRGLLVKAT